MPTTSRFYRGMRRCITDFLQREEVSNSRVVEGLYRGSLSVRIAYEFRTVFALPGNG